MQQSYIEQPCQSVISNNVKKNEENFYLCYSGLYVPHKIFSLFYKREELRKYIFMIAHANCLFSESMIACTITEKRQIGCAITKKRQIACVIIEKRQSACAITEKRHTACAITEKRHRYHVLSWKKRQLTCAITVKRQIACVIMEKYFRSSSHLENCEKILCGTYKPSYFVGSSDRIKTHSHFS